MGALLVAPARQARIRIDQGGARFDRLLAKPAQTGSSIAP
jgi:hypothetical protein